MFAQCCVFGKQSPPPLICNQTTLRAQGSSRCWHTLSRSYGVNLPSSLTWFHSRALGFSPCPPVSVWGTDHLLQRLAAFLVSRGSSPSRPKPTASHLGVNDLAYLTTRSSYMLAPELPVSGVITLLRSRVAPQLSTGILTCHPSTTPFGLALGSD